MHDVLYHHSRLCNLEEVKKQACVVSLKADFNPIKDCDCHNYSYCETYDVTMPKLDRPTKRSFRQFFASVYISLKSSTSISFLLKVLRKNEEEKQDKLDMDSLAVLSLKSTFGHFNVFFKELSMTLIEKRPIYNFVIVASYLGGLLVLYLGFNVLAVLELVDFGFNLVEYFSWQGKFWWLIKLLKNAKKWLTSRVELFRENTAIFPV